MIRTVTLNPAVDRTVEIENFAIGAVNRVSSSRLDAGGKGINVSKAIRRLGGQSLCYGFLGGSAGRFIRAYLDSQGIAGRFVELDGETRTNLKVADPALGSHTDINEFGPRADARDLERLEEELFADARSRDLFVFSGSVCPGLGAGVYASWIRRARSLGASTALDADGEALKLGALAGPTLMKPNIAELERLVGYPLSSGGKADPSAVARAARGLLSAGTKIVVVSLGAEGAVFVNAERAIRAFGIPIRALSTVGAGDSQVASLCLSLERGANFEGLVAPAIAAGTAAAATEGSEAFDPSLLPGYEAAVRYEDLA